MGKFGFAALAILAVGIVSTASPAHAWDPKYPVCMRIYEGMNYSTDECNFTNMEQCQMSASGRPAQCLVNPFYEAPRAEAAVRRHKRRHRVPNS